MVHFSAQRRARVLVVEDHGLVREGITLLLERDAAIEVIGGAGTGKEAVAIAKRTRPDVVVMDLVLPELSGIDATVRILAALPDTRIVILTTSLTSEHIFLSLRAGALGYVDKQATAADLLHAVHQVRKGERYLSTAAARVFDTTSTEAQRRSPLERLSTREREVLNLAARGTTSAEIARKLSLSPKTVETYRSRIMKKLGVADHAALIRFAIEHALTPA